MESRRELRDLLHRGRDELRILQQFVGHAFEPPLYSHISNQPVGLAECCREVLLKELDDRLLVDGNAGGWKPFLRGLLLQRR